MEKYLWKELEKKINLEVLNFFEKHKDKLDLNDKLITLGSLTNARLLMFLDLCVKEFDKKDHDIFIKFMRESLEKTFGYLTLLINEKEEDNERNR